MSSTGEVDNSMALVKYQPPPTPAQWRLMFSRLSAEVGGVLFYQLAALRKWMERAFYDETLPSGPLSPEQEEWHMNQNAKRFLAYAKSFTPRILFRGFTADSGGGGDTRLNGPDGIIPHGFLDGKIPTSMWDITELFDMINMHLDQDPNVVSDFSSWSQIWMTALGFSEHLYDPDGRVAVLDTTTMEDHVWHTVDLKRAKLAEKKFEDEYLVYGPITGPKYYCVSPRELHEKTRIRDLLQDTPFLFGEDPGSCAIEGGAVHAAKEVAAFLQPPGACVENLAVLTARFASYRASWLTVRAELDTEDEDPGSKGEEVSDSEPDADEMDIDSESGTDAESDPNAESDTDEDPASECEEASGSEPDADSMDIGSESDSDAESGTDPESDTGSESGIVNNWPGQRDRLPQLDIERYLFHVRDYIQDLAMSTEDGEVTLVDSTMFAGRRFLRFEVQLLQAMENAVRVTAQQVKVTMREVCRV